MELREERGELRMGEEEEGQIMLDRGEGIKIVFLFLCTRENGHLKLCGWRVPEGD